MILFRQTRVGKDGVPFTMLKFETMRDGKVTRPFLRRSGLDELPQLWNILRGDMAIFGPRPELPEIHARASRALGDTWDARLRVKPGLLSIATVACPRLRTDARYDIDAQAEKAVLDNTMIDSGTRVRLGILRRAPRAILRGQEAMA